MDLGMIILIIAVIVVAGLIFFKGKDLKQKLFTVLFVFLILFALISFNTVYGGKDISIKNISDVGKVANLYFSWIGNVFNNLKIITANAIEMNWQGNKTS
jgi:cell shape-determining protein MreC